MCTKTTVCESFIFVLQFGTSKFYPGKFKTSPNGQIQLEVLNRWLARDQLSHVLAGATVFQGMVGHNGATVIA